MAAPVETPVAGGSSEVPEAGAPLCATAGLDNARASAEAPAAVKNRVRNRDITLPPLWHGHTAVADDRQNVVSAQMTSGSVYLGVLRIIIKNQPLSISTLKIAD